MNFFKKNKNKFFAIILTAFSPFVSAQIITAEFSANFNGGNNSTLSKITGTDDHWSDSFSGSYTYDDAVSVFSNGLFHNVTPIESFTITYPNSTYVFSLSNIDAASLYSNGTYVGAYLYNNSYGLNLFSPLILDHYNELSNYVPPATWWVAFTPDGSGFSYPENGVVFYSNYSQTIKAVPIPSMLMLHISAFLYLIKSGKRKHNASRYWLRSCNGALD